MSTLGTDWPSEPYKGLVWYGPEDRLLFSGRDRDVETCIHFLAASETRILLLHGQTGCGKSSFLRAGLIPGLEENAFGYLFLRDAAGAPLFIRSGADPLGRVAEQVFRFASQPVSVPGIAGKTYDLSAALLDRTDLPAYVEECRRPGMLLKSLRALSTAIPFTLVIILDQAEEVITFSDSNHDHRRQFFRFIREFGTSNFPVKFILALRKDYSGEFIGLAQLGSSIDLRAGAPDASQPSPAGAAADRVVKSDIKIFLLAELTRQEVTYAIELPTSKERIYEERPPPFEKYRFSYAPGTAKQIVDDLFAATSAAAVLPVMQIVCRDLYNEARHGKSAPWLIDAALYRKGGGISGPVDRHVSKSLRDSFGRLPAGVDAAAEEQRWRELLYRLVRREADGTVHTNIVDEAQLKAMSAEIGVAARLDEVTAYLTRSDVLLLRSVSMLAGAEGRESRLFSLGHDAIGLVLQEWKMRALASQRVAEEEKASLARIRRATAKGFVGVLLAGLVVFAIFLAAAKGGADQKHNFLLNIASAIGRSAPMDAMYAAAQATYVADDLRQYELHFKEKDPKADQLLSNYLAGMAATTTFQSAAAKDSGLKNPSMPLPKWVAFASVDGGTAEIVFDVQPGGGKRLQFDLGKLSDDPSMTWSAGEPTPGTVILLRGSPTPLVAGEGGANVERVYVLTKDKQGQAVQPFPAEYFRGKTSIAAFKARAPRGVKVASRDPAQLPADEPPDIGLSGGTVVITKSTFGNDPMRGEFSIASFVFDPTRPPADPFRLAFERTFRLDRTQLDASGFADYVLLDGQLVVSATLEPRAAEATPPAWGARYDLATGDRTMVHGFDSLAECRFACDWEFIARETPDNLLLFGKARPGATAGATQSREQAQRQGFDRFERFVVVDAVADRSFAIDAGAIQRAREECAKPFERNRSADGPKLPASSMFLADGKQRLLFGLQSERSVDLVQVSKVDGAVPKCVGTLFYGDEVSTWQSARDGSVLLAGGNRTGFSWDVSKDTASTAQDLRARGGLVPAVCALGLRDHEQPGDDWIANTTKFLGPQERKLCEGAQAPPAKPGRTPATFPGLDVTTRGDLPSALKK